MNRHLKQQQPGFQRNGGLPLARLTSIAYQITKKIAAYILLLTLSLTTQQGFAQAPVTTDVTGIVINDKGEVLQGATVLATNTATRATSTSVTDDNGAFRLRKLVVGNKYDYTFSFLGYELSSTNGLTVSQNAKENFISIKLKEKNAMLGQVVVTALGIVQKKAALGYATQEVKGSTLNEARDNNFVSSLSGRVAGVNIISGNGV
ncbi:MAG: carboxypeptidase regulatory-like domain-containing protein, partial [Ferruginibacter sp.]|nr:carboxypeptidase regulatory-like domain-containing protein [Ferruginibacter sp.]